MKIISLTLKNFRQFYGEQKIEFSTDKEKNITLIHAENGVGKTALLNAIKWCLFEQTTHNFSQKENLINHYAKDNAEDSYYVALEFEENDNIFYCERGFNRISKKYFKMSREDHRRGIIPIDDPDLFTNSIMPKEMSEYFFFQGEGVDSFTKFKAGQNFEVKRAIQDVLGFNTAKQAISDLSDIKKDYRKEIASRNKDPELAKLHREISDLEQEKTKKAERHAACIRNITNLNHHISGIDAKLANSDSSVVKRNHQDRVNLDKKIQLLISEIDRKEKEKVKLIRGYGAYVFAGKLASQALDFINEEEFKGTIPAPYNENLVRQILEQHECICGAPINDHSEAYNNISKLLKNAADPDQGNRVIRARETLKSIQTKNEDSKDRLLSNRQDLFRLKNELEETKKGLEQISLKMIEVNIDEISGLEKQRETYQQEKDSEHRLQGSLEANLERLQPLIESKQSRINQLRAESTGIDIYQESLDILEEVETLLENTLANAEKSSFSELSRLINNTLDKYVRQDFKAKIDKNSFNIRLIDNQERSVAMSDGQQLLLSLTFISSLIELAASRKNAQGEILTPGVIAPFVIDAPFGVLDNTYKGNMAKSIPESVEQVVFLLSSSHWEGTVEENIRSKVGREYNLVAEVSASQGSKELNPIYIKGRKIDTVRYNCDIDRTVIEEVRV